MSNRMSAERRAIYVERRQTDRERTAYRAVARRNKYAESRAIVTTGKGGN